MISKLKEQWVSESPKLFKWLTNVCVTAVACGTALMGLEHFDKLPETLKGLSSNLLGYGTLGSVLFKFTKKGKTTE